MKTLLAKCWEALTMFNVALGLFSLGIWWTMAVMPFILIYQNNVTTNSASIIFFTLICINAINIVSFIVAEFKS